MSIKANQLMSIKANQLLDVYTKLICAQQALDGASILASSACGDNEAEMALIANQLAARITGRARDAAARVTAGFVDCGNSREPIAIAHDVMALYDAIDKF